jgi:murein L,D-transpeptidase YafK
MSRRLRFFGVLFAAFAGALSPLQAATAPPVENQFLQAVESLRAGRVSDAQDQLAALVRREPQFRVAQLLYAQVLAARSGEKAALARVAPNSPQLKELLDEYRARVQDTVLQGPPAGSMPDTVLGLSGTHRSAIVVDLPRSRLYVLANNGNGLRLVSSYYASIARNGYGKSTAGDLRTPVGIYHATTFEPGNVLPPFYGSGAFPLDYPNLWDRMLGRTGHGIWLHGVPVSTYARPPRTSEGCVVLANEDVLALRSWIVPGDTPVVFSDNVRWTAPTAVAGQRSELIRRIDGWRTRWSERDTDGYLGFYATDFHVDGMNLSQFARYKRSVNAGKHRIDVRVRDLDLLRYPGEKDLVLAEFTQDYRSDNFATVSRKQQFWRRGSDGQWRIIRELSRELPQSIARN